MIHACETASGELPPGCQSAGEFGFQLIRQSGSHATYRHPDRRWTIVSIHPGKTIPKGTLRKIIRDAGLTISEFLEALKK